MNMTLYTQKTTSPIKLLGTIFMLNELIVVGYIASSSPEVLT